MILNYRPAATPIASSFPVSATVRLADWKPLSKWLLAVCLECAVRYFCVCHIWTVGGDCNRNWKHWGNIQPNHPSHHQISVKHYSSHFSVASRAVYFPLIVFSCIYRKQFFFQLVISAFSMLFKVFILSKYYLLAR